MEIKKKKGEKTIFSFRVGKLQDMLSSDSFLNNLLVLASVLDADSKNFCFRTYISSLGGSNCFLWNILREERQSNSKNCYLRRDLIAKRGKRIHLSNAQIIACRN